MPERCRSIVDVHVILHRDGEILLLERQNTGYCDGMLHLPSGHLEEGEALHHGAAREAREEVGVTVDPDTLALAAVVHHRQRPDLARIGVFFTTRIWQGEPRSAEPHKCGGLVWADPHLLPHNTIDYPAQGIRTWLADTGHTPTTGPPPPADSPARTAVYPLAVDAPARARTLFRQAGEVRDGVRVRPARFPPGGHRRFWREGRERCLAACGACWTGGWWPSSRVPVQRLDL